MKMNKFVKKLIIRYMKKVKSVFYIVFLCLYTAFIPTLKGQVRKTILLDKDWKFLNADLKSADLFNLNDANWEVVDVPHDWAIRKNFDMNLDAQYVKVIEDGEDTQNLRTGRTGALPIFGVGWYRKVLPLTIADKGKSVSIEFD